MITLPKILTGTSRSALQTVHHAIGIDISDGSLELVNLGESRSHMMLIKEHARVVIPDNVIVHGIIRDERALRTALKHLLAKAKLHDDRFFVVTALPDVQVITKSIPLESGHGKHSYDALDAMARHAYVSL